MMTRYKNMDEFLKFWRDIVKENPYLNLTDDIVYNQLIRLGVKESDKRINLRYNYNVNKSVFNEWISYYNFNSNINVFNSSDWSYFCQFISNHNIVNAKNHIKVYIPLDSEHIEKGAKLIFDFLSNNNIPHHSKIGEEIRFDDIVIRLINPYDAERLINFVTTNSYLSKGLIAPNPFAFQKNGIALACDGRLSYNDTVSILISNYINTMKNSNKLDEIEITDFYSYILKIYNNDYLIKYIFNDSDYKLENRKQVLELITSSFLPNFSYEDYIAHYKKYSDINTNQKRFILNTAVRLTASKYNYGQCYSAIYKVINERNYNLFTNDGNARINLMAISPDEIREIVFNSLQNNKVTLPQACVDYVDGVLNESVFTR